MKNQIINKNISRRKINLLNAKKTNRKIILDICGGTTPYRDDINNVDIWTHRVYIYSLQQ